MNGKYHIIYEENSKGYLLLNTSIRLEALELYKAVLDDFFENDYIFSDKIFKVEEKFKVVNSYPILSHKLTLRSSDNFKVLCSLELENSFIYHIQSAEPLTDLIAMSRIQVESVEFISKNLNQDIKIDLN